MWYLMLAVAVGGFLVAVERFFYLHKGKIRATDFVTGIVNLVKKGRSVEALSLCGDTPGPVAAIVKVGLLNIRKNPQELGLALQGAAAAEIPLLEKRVNTLLFLSRLVQLLGLLAALVQLRGPFVALAQGGGVLNTQTLGAATTGAITWLIASLSMGIIFYLLYHLLHGRVRALVAEMERASVELQSQMQQAQNAQEAT